MKRPEIEPGTVYGWFMIAVVAAAIAFTVWLITGPHPREDFRKQCRAEGHFVVYEKGGLFCEDRDRHFLREFVE